MTAIKSERAAITLGDIELDVFRLPDESYRWSARNITEAINIAHTRCAQICSSKQAQSLIGSRFESAHLSPTKLTTSDAGNISGYSTEVAFFIWQYEAIKGNALAQAIVFASGVEVLERRADAAFKVIRAIEEVNERFIARKDSILQRHFWTDCIKWYIDNHPELSDNAKRFLYPNVSDTLNKALFGMTAKEIRVALDMHASENIRDCINPAHLPDITFLEKYAGTRVKQGLEPMQAIKEAIAFCNYEVRSPK